MWLLLWTVVLIGVHIQFKHCRQITITMFKIVETSLIVFALQLMTQDTSHWVSHWGTHWGTWGTALETAWNNSKIHLDL